MGNCQSNEAEMVVIQHPGGRRVDRIYWSVRATIVMGANPGHYVALVIAVPETGAKLKLLRPDETLLLGKVYRLISFEDVLNEFRSRKSSKLWKLLSQTGVTKNSIEDSNPNSNSSPSSSDDEGDGVPEGHVGKGGWRPALHSIPECGY